MVATRGGREAGKEQSPSENAGSLGTIPPSSSSDELPRTRSNVSADRPLLDPTDSVIERPENKRRPLTQTQLLNYIDPRTKELVLRVQASSIPLLYF